MDFEPYFKSAEKNRSTDHLKDLFFENLAHAQRGAAIINSTCFYLWFTVQGNCRNITRTDIDSFPCGLLSEASLHPLDSLFTKLMDDYRKHSKRRVYVYEASGEVEYDEFYVNKSKPILDEIDSVLAQHYGLTDEELDFLINYDIKYRLKLGSSIGKVGD
jgi:hypothetical protein